MTAAKMAAIGGLVVVGLLLVVWLVGLPGGAAEGGREDAAGSVEGELYRNPELGFAIEAPAGWVVDTSGILDADVVFFGPRRGDFTMTMSMRHEERPTELKAYVDRSVKRVWPGLLTDFNTVDEELDMTLADPDVKAIRVVYTYSQGEHDLTGVVTVYGIDDLKVTVTFTLPTEYYEDFRDQIDSSIKSFHRL